MSGYNVQCLQGHTYELPVGDPLVGKCADHAAEGFIDALMLPPDECRECIEEFKEKREHFEGRREFEEGLNDFFDIAFATQERGDI